MTIYSGPIAEQAIARFGEPNVKRSSRDELRFGRQGSVAVQLRGEDAGAWFDFEANQGGRFDLAPEAAVTDMPRIIVQKYDYVDEHGELRYQVCRYMPKEFRQRRPDPDNPGRWLWNLQGVEPLLFNLPAIIDAPEVVIVEGEKDVLALQAVGVAATCNSGGAGKWHDGFARWFRGKHVLVVADNDEAGRKHAHAVALALHDSARSVRVCDVCANLPAKGDVSDLLAGGMEAEQLLAQLRACPTLEEQPLDEGDVFDFFVGSEAAVVAALDDFVEGTLIAAQLSVVYGPSNSGKTFFASDLALHLAKGWRWNGLDTDAGGVVYVAAEGAAGIRNRIAAFKKHYEVAGDLPIAVVTAAPNLYDSDEELARLINTVRVAGRRIGGALLVVIDTLSRVMAGAEENSAADMSLVIAHCDDICRATGAHVMLVHHTGKDAAKGARGSSSLRAAVATEIEIEPGTGGSVARVTKQRDLEIAGEWHFGLKVVELGTNRRGKAITSCVVVPADVQAAKGSKAMPSGKNQKLLYAALRRTLADHAVPWKITDGPVVQAVDIEQWRQVAYSRMTDVDTRHKAGAFNRAVNALVADEFVMVERDMAWVTGSQRL